MNNKQLAVLVDISGIMRRNFAVAQKQGYDQLPNAYQNGQPVYLINSTLNTLRNELEVVATKHKRAISHLLVAFDHPGKTFRHHIYQEYKASRETPPPEYTSQVALIKEKLESLGICCIQSPNVEADDVLASVTKKLKELRSRNLEFSIAILCRDKDALALIDEHTSIYSGADKKLITLNNLQDKIPVPPSKVPDYLAMVGDSADGIPGIPNFGLKSAKEVLAQYELYDVLGNPSLLSDLTFRGRDSAVKWIEENKALLLCYHNLCRLHEDVPLGISLKQMAYNNALHANY